MPANADMRKLSMGVVTIIAMVAVLLPMCIGLSCGMGTMGLMGSSAVGFSSDCVGTMTSVAQAAIAPGSPQSLILLLVAAFGVAFVLAAPPFAMRPVRAVAKDPPAPPEDPRGVRLII